MSSAVSIACGELLALRRGVYSTTLPNGDLRLLAWPHVESFGRLSAGQQAVLRSLAEQAHAREELLALGAGQDGTEDGVARLLDQLYAGGWLRITVSHGGRALYTLDPLRSPPPPPEEVELSAAQHRSLSRFALLRRDDGGMVLESPLAWCDLRVHDPMVLAMLGELAKSPESLPSGVSERLVRDLSWAGMAVPAPDAEDAELRLSQWSPHELWFHERSRIGYRALLGTGFGGTFWARDRFDPLPARPEVFPGPAVELYRPDLEALRRTDPTLTAVLEDRRSIRAQDEDSPITAEQLGEFLYRCARNRWVGRNDGMEVTSRPYPSGGAAYELELYPVVRHAVGLEPGMYHYDSHSHRLRLVREASHPAVRRLLRASVPFGQSTSQVLIVISARVGRMMWKYEAMPYAVILKNVGALYQSMYCVATAMGLAPCGIGAGDAVAFTEATGRDPLEECGVGELALGTCSSENLIQEKTP